MGLTQVFQNFSRRLSEEIQVSVVADPSSYVQAEMEKLGWVFLQSDPYPVFNGDQNVATLVYDSQYRLAYKTDEQAPLATDPQARRNYLATQRAIIQRIPWGLPFRK